jgi:hypothetical protein
VDNKTDKLTADGAFELRERRTDDLHARTDLGHGPLRLEAVRHGGNHRRGAAVFLSDGKLARGNNAKVSAKLTTIFSLKVSNTIRFVNQPVPGFLKTDTVTAIALVAKF